MGQPGRPSVFTEQIGDEICQRLSQGQTLTSICRDEHLPPLDTIIGWVMADSGAAFDAGFQRKYARAREVQLEHMAEEVQDISDDARNDYMDRVVGKDGETVRVLDNEHVQRSRLRVDTRKWLLSHRAPARYGDRIAHQMLDEHGKPARAGITVIVDGAPGESEPPKS
jgi:hypothetical protein